MGPGIASLALLEVFLVLAAVVFAASAFMRLHNLQEEYSKKMSALITRLDEIERRLEQFEEATAAGTAPSANSEAARIPRPAPPPKTVVAPGQTIPRAEIPPTPLARLPEPRHYPPHEHHRGLRPWRA
jgi:hypothetical protein